MDLTDMLALVRRDLKDTVEANYRWTDDELERHIGRAVKEYSESLPLEVMVTTVTTAGSRTINLAGEGETPTPVCPDLVVIQAVEYPVDLFPRRYQRFSVWGDILSILGPELPDGSNVNIYYGKLHDLGAASTIPARHEDIVATGAAGYAALSWGVYSVNRVNTGGAGTPEQWSTWGNVLIGRFERELNRMGRRSRVRVGTLYVPYE